MEKKKTTREFERLNGTSTNEFHNDKCRKILK